MIMSKDNANAFVDRYGSPYTFLELFESNKQLMQDVFDEYTLIGFAWDMQEDPDPVAHMVGRIWMRFDKTMIGSPDHLFNSSPFKYGHVGWGGYSTYGGPWNKLGAKIAEMNHGVASHHQIHFEAYAFSFEFGRAAFPNILESDVMHKIAGTRREDAHERTWHRPGQREIDDDRILQLLSIRNQMELRTST